VFAFIAPAYPKLQISAAVVWNSACDSLRLELGHFPPLQRFTGVASSFHCVLFIPSQSFAMGLKAAASEVNQQYHGKRLKYFGAIGTSVVPHAVGRAFSTPMCLAANLLGVLVPDKVGGQHHAYIMRDMRDAYVQACCILATSTTTTGSRGFACVKAVQLHNTAA
jgi:hypothetical protein